MTSNELISMTHLVKRNQQQRVCCVGCLQLETVLMAAQDCWLLQASLDGSPASLLKTKALSPTGGVKEREELWSSPHPELRSSATKLSSASKRTRSDLRSAAKAKDRGWSNDKVCTDIPQDPRRSDMLSGALKICLVTRTLRKEREHPQISFNDWPWQG